MPLASMDLDTLRSALGPSDNDGEWRLQDDEACFSYVELDSHPLASQEGEPPLDVAHVIVRTFRSTSSIDQAVDGTAKYSDFLDALELAVAQDVEETGWTVVCEMAFPGDTQWQLPILASPPPISQADSALGRVSMAGVTLQFADSSIGLTRAALEGSFGPYPPSLKLMFRTTVARPELKRLFKVVLDRAEDFAKLFIDIQPGTEVEA